MGGDGCPRGKEKEGRVLTDKTKQASIEGIRYPRDKPYV